VAATQFLSQYNPLYRAIKRRLPDVLVGCPDVCGVEFSEVLAGRVRWNDFIVPILDGAEGLDFFDYHYYYYRSSPFVRLNAPAEGALACHQAGQ